MCEHNFLVADGVFAGKRTCARASPKNLCLNVLICWSSDTRQANLFINKMCARVAGCSSPSTLDQCNCRCMQIVHRLTTEATHSPWLLRKWYGASVTVWDSGAWNRNRLKRNAMTENSYVRYGMFAFYCQYLNRTREKTLWHAQFTCRFDCFVWNNDRNKDRKTERQREREREKIKI